MGKSHRNVYAGSNSVDYHSPQNRGFAKEKKAKSHRRVRAHNKTANEDNIKSINDLHSTEIMNNHCSSLYYDEVGNLPNKQEFRFTDEYLKRAYDIKWTKDEKSQLDTVNKALEDGHQDPAFKMCKKQIERRGSVGLFYGHR